MGWGWCAWTVDIFASPEFSAFAINIPIIIIIIIDCRIISTFQASCIFFLFPIPRPISPNSNAVHYKKNPNQKKRTKTGPSNLNSSNKLQIWLSWPPQYRPPVAHIFQKSLHLEDCELPWKFLTLERVWDISKLSYCVLNGLASRWCLSTQLRKIIGSNFSCL